MIIFVASEIKLKILKNGRSSASHSSSFPHSGRLPNKKNHSRMRKACLMITLLVDEILVARLTLSHSFQTSDDVTQRESPLLTVQ